MQLPPKKFLIVMEALGFIAMNAGSQPVSAKEICHLLQGISERYLEPIMQKLVHHKILRSIRGPKGGYVLARERRKITLDEIFTLVQSLEEHPAIEYSPLGKNVLCPIWEKVEHSLLEQLQQITLDDVCRQAEEQQVPLARASGDFAI
jgi:Rrf2 family transcriptional regulator, iron-sulfur cluster assembly transcription factor